MIWRDLQDVLGKERRKKERAKAVHQYAVGMGIMAVLGVATGIMFAPKSGKESRRELREKAVNTAEIIKDTVQEKIDTIKDSMAYATQEASDVIKDVQEKAEDDKKDIKVGS